MMRSSASVWNTEHGIYAKPYDPTIVRFRVKNVIERSQMRMDDELKYRAEHDVLTGILNKSKFFYNTRNMLNIFGTEDFVIHQDRY